MILVLVRFLYCFSIFIFFCFWFRFCGYLLVLLLEWGNRWLEVIYVCGCFYFVFILMCGDIVVFFSNYGIIYCGIVIMGGYFIGIINKWIVEIKMFVYVKRVFWWYMGDVLIIDRLLEKY